MSEQADERELVNLIVRELGKHRSVDDVTRLVVDQSELNWSDARKFVQRVMFEQRSEIVQRRAPILLIVGGFAIVAGLALATAMTIATLNGIAIFFIVFPMPYLGNIVSFMLGILMAVGGIIGLLRMKL